MSDIGARFAPSRLHDSYDVIVIGSGLGGLCAASLLSQNGLRVLVLEQHHAIGGCAQVVRGERYSWSLGSEEVGDAHPVLSPTRRMVDVVTRRRVEWTPLPRTCRRIAIGDRVFEIPRGPDALLGYLESLFPSERLGVSTVLELVHEIDRTSRGFFDERMRRSPEGARLYPDSIAAFRGLSDRTTHEVLSRLVFSPELLALLCGTYGAYGLPPRRSSFAMHALHVRDTLFGASRPKGGLDAIPRAMTLVIEESGGQVLHSASVERVALRRGQVTGVVLSGGEEIAAPCVISNAGARVTFGRLLKTGLAREQQLRKLVGALPPSSSMASLHLGLRCSAESLGLRGVPLWVHPSHDLDGSANRLRQDPKAPPAWMKISCSPHRGGGWTTEGSRHCTVSMVAEVGFGRFEPWLDPDSGAADEQRYRALKDELSESFLDVLDHHVPGARAQITEQRLLTPLTFGRLLGRPRGATLGLATTPERFGQRWLRPDSPIKGLYLTGQDVAYPGITGAMLGGFLCSSSILGINLTVGVR